jgi:hypothetical protein
MDTYLVNRSVGGFTIQAKIKDSAIQILRIFYPKLQKGELNMPFFSIVPNI